MTRRKDIEQNYPGRLVVSGLGNLLKFSTPTNPVLYREVKSLSQEDIEHRQAIADEVKQALAKLPPAPDRLSLPEEERPSLEDTLRQHLLGLVGDNALIKHISPQTDTDVNARSAIAKTDPIWTPVLPLLTPFEMHKTSAAFMALRLFYEHTHADKDRVQARINLLMRDILPPGENGRFETVGDLRRLSLKAWNNISNIGTVSAVLMHESIRKVVIPTE